MCSQHNKTYVGGDITYSDGYFESFSITCEEIKEIKTKSLDDGYLVLIS